MKNVIYSLGILVYSLNIQGQSPKRVSGHYKNNGTYVQPHYRTKTNNTQSDNWSSKPNVNPYTGKYGTKTSSCNSRGKRN